MDSERNPGCAKADRKMLVVAERLVLRFAAAAKRGSRQRLDGAVLTPDLDLAGHQQWPVAHQRDSGRPFGILLRPPIQSPVLQRAAWTSQNDLGDVVCISLVRQDPRPAIELEDVGLPAQAFADVDADAQVKADLYVPPPIDLAHLPLKDTSACQPRSWIWSG